MGKKNTEEALADETDLLVREITKQEVGGVIGGFPCQDISIAGRRTGLAGSRSGLFWEMAETVRMVRPKYWLLENVAALFRSERQSDMGAILGELARSWPHIEWDCVGAGTVGAPHHRARAYILAHDGNEAGRRLFPREIQWQPEFLFWRPYKTPSDIPRRSDLFESQLCRGGNGVAKRLHVIGNGNPPCVIRELTRGLK